MTPAALSRLRSWPPAIAGLLAILALYKMESASLGLPIWAALVLLSAFTRARLPNTPAVVWLLRFLLFGFVVITNIARPVDVVNIYDSKTMTWFGEFCSAELTLACWTI